MKDSLIEMKNNLKGNNSRMVEAKYQINDLAQKESKQNQPIRTTRRKNRIPTNEDSIGSFWDNFNWSNIHSHHRGARRRRKRARNWKSI